MNQVELKRKALMLIDDLGGVTAIQFSELVDCSYYCCRKALEALWVECIVKKHKMGTPRAVYQRVDVVKENQVTKVYIDYPKTPDPKEEVIWERFLSTHHPEVKEGDVIAMFYFNLRVSAYRAVLSSPSTIKWVKVRKRELKSLNLLEDLVVEYQDS